MVYTEVNCSEAIMQNRFSAEFFDPKYSFIPNSKYEWRKIGRSLKKCQYGISIAMNEDGKGYPIFRMNELENCFATKAVKYANISDKEFQQFEINENDILFNRTNSINFVGRTGIVKEKTNSVFASYLVRLVPDINFIRPEYLAIYLNTKFGIGQIRRRAMPSINQANVSAAELKQILIPLFPLPIQDEIAEVVNESFYLLQLSKSHYAKAQELLERELGLDKLVFDKPLSYEAELSEVVGNNRADAEYFHAKYVPLLNLISFYGAGCLPLSKLATEIIPNINLQKETGDYDYIEIGDIAISDGSYTKNRINVKNLPANAKIKLSGGEIIISQVRPTRGAISIISDELDYPTLCSGAFYTCRINDISYREIIWLYIRSIRGIFEKFCGGTSYPTIDSHYVSKLMIPIFERSFAEKIKNLIIDSKKAKTESQLLLEQAKLRVEELIEQGVKK